MDKNSLEIKQFRHGSDNLSYLIFNDKYAVAVDGVAVSTIVSFLKNTNRQLRFVLNTHKHTDHTAGNIELINKTGAEYISPEYLIKLGKFTLGKSTINAIPTPGHTSDSLILQFNNILVTGDTLFNGTIGNCFSGNMNAFYKSLMMLAALPSHLKVYAGHDYVRDAMRFAKWLEPNNPAIIDYLNHYMEEHVVSSISQELKVNPYFRFNEPEIIAVLQKRSLPIETEYERWFSLMSID